MCTFEEQDDIQLTPTTAGGRGLSQHLPEDGLGGLVQTPRVQVRLLEALLAVNTEPRTQQESSHCIYGNTHTGTLGGHSQPQTFSGQTGAMSGPSRMTDTQA